MFELTKLSTKQKDEFIELLKKRFEENMHRHPTIQWDNNIEEKLLNQPDKFAVL